MSPCDGSKSSSAQFEGIGRFAGTMNCMFSRSFFLVDSHQPLYLPSGMTWPLSISSSWSRERRPPLPERNELHKADGIGVGEVLDSSAELKRFREEGVLRDGGRDMAANFIPSSWPFFVSKSTITFTRVGPTRRSCRRPSFCDGRRCRGGGVPVAGRGPVDFFALDQLFEIGMHVFLNIEEAAPRQAKNFGCQ